MGSHFFRFILVRGSNKANPDFLLADNDACFHLFDAVSVRMEAKPPLIVAKNSELFSSVLFDQACSTIPMIEVLV